MFTKTKSSTPLLTAYSPLHAERCAQHWYDSARQNRGDKCVPDNRRHTTHFRIRGRLVLELRAIIVAAMMCAGWTQASAADIAIEHAKVFEAPGTAPLLDTTVLIRNGQIAAVSKRVELRPGTRTLPCKGCVVFAGFWNSHVHFTGPQWSDAANAPRQTLERQLQEMLTRSGFTSVVDTGSDIAITGSLRDRIEHGEVAGPQIYTAGLPLFPANALPYYLADLPASFKTRLGQPTSPKDARSFVARNHAAGADITKLFTGSIVAPDKVQPMREDIAAAAVVESHRMGAPVFAHATNLAGLRVAIASGVDVLAHAPEHLDGIDRTVIPSMVQTRIAVIPTLMLFAQDQNIAQIRHFVLAAHRGGVPLIFGTDTGFLANYDVSEEFRQLSLAGLNLTDILTMLTTAPAALFKAEGRRGRVVPGMDGDLTVLGSDPEEDGVGAFSNVRFTIRRGEVLYDSTRPLQ